MMIYLKRNRIPIITSLLGILVGVIGTLGYEHFRTPHAQKITTSNRADTYSAMKSLINPHCVYFGAFHDGLFDNSGRDFVILKAAVPPDQKGKKLDYSDIFLAAETIAEIPDGSTIKADLSGFGIRSLYDATSNRKISAEVVNHFDSSYSASSHLQVLCRNKTAG